MKKLSSYIRITFSNSVFSHNANNCYDVVILLYIAHNQPMFWSVNDEQLDTTGVEPKVGPVSGGQSSTLFGTQWLKSSIHLM